MHGKGVNFRVDFPSSGSKGAWIPNDFPAFQDVPWLEKTAQWDRKIAGPPGLRRRSIMGLSPGGVPDRTASAG